MKKNLCTRAVIAALLFSFSAFCLGSSVGYANHLIQVGRYTSVNTEPTQAEVNPLDAVVAFRFPSSVKTVGGALKIVLANTGFRIADASKLSSDVKSTLKMPLPITNRVLGLMIIKEAVAVLMGRNVYAPQVNLLKRTVNFSLNKDYQPKILHKKLHKVLRKTADKKCEPSKGERYEFI